MREDVRGLPHVGALTKAFPSYVVLPLQFEIVVGGRVTPLPSQFARCLTLTTFSFCDVGWAAGTTCKNGLPGLQVGDACCKQECRQCGGVDCSTLALEDGLTAAEYVCLVLGERRLL